MTYTVLNRHGEVQESGVSLKDAAESVMLYDGQEFEIRKFSAGFELWVPQFSRNSTLGGRPKVRSVIYSLKLDREAAEAEIFAQVVKNSAWWSDQRVMTDEPYTAEQAEIAADWQ